MNKIKSFVKLTAPLEDEPAVLNYEEFDEKAFVRLMNYRDPPVIDDAPAIDTTSRASVSKQPGELKPSGSQEELKSQEGAVSETASQKELRTIESFVFELVPPKIIMLNPINQE